jgi:hypothetical protein
MGERTTIRLPEDLVRRVKRKAAAEGVSMTFLIEEGLRRVLNERGASRKTNRVLPPISTAKGGLMPGIDLNDSAALEEMDDLERIRRPT